MIDMSKHMHTHTHKQNRKMWVLARRALQHGATQLAILESGNRGIQQQWEAAMRGAAEGGISCVCGGAHRSQKRSSQLDKHYVVLRGGRVGSTTNGTDIRVYRALAHTHPHTHTHPHLLCMHASITQHTWSVNEQETASTTKITLTCFDHSTHLERQ